MYYPHHDSKIDFCLRHLILKILVLARALPIGNGRLLRSRILRVSLTNSQFLKHDMYIMGLLIFKGLCSGFFYTFISISGMILVAHYIMGKSAKMGWVASLGIMTVQFLYSLIASLIIFGFITSVDMENPAYTLIGSAILFIMAIKIYRSREKYDQKDRTSSNPLKAYIAGFLIALAFPIRILGYTAIFTALKIHPQTATALFFPAIGVALGSFLWWIIYVISVKKTHKMISPKTLQQFHRYAALILILFSLIGLSRLFL